MTYIYYMDNMTNSPALRVRTCALISLRCSLQVLAFSKTSERVWTWAKLGKLHWYGSGLSENGIPLKQLVYHHYWANYNHSLT